jgi:hypothetical protein
MASRGNVVTAAGMTRRCVSAAAGVSAAAVPLGKYRRRRQ